MDIDVTTSRASGKLRLLTILPPALLAAGCVETSGLTAPSAATSGKDYGGDVVSVSLRTRDDGNQVATLSAGLDYTCTSVFDEAPSAGGSELSHITCTDGSNGNATLRYDSAAQPAQFVYGLGAGKGGSLRF